MIFNHYFRYPFRRTLPRKQLERHQWLDTLCKLEYEPTSVMFIALWR